MSHHNETNPHFLPRQHDPIIEFPSHTPPPRSRPPSRHRGHAPVVVEALPHGPPTHGAPPPHGHPASHPPPSHSPQHTPHVKPVTPLAVEVPHQESRPHSDSHTRPQHGRGGRHPAFIHPPTSQRTKPLTWLLAAFCMLFWILVIVGGLIILIVYLVFRPRSPWFDISTATINAAYLDMGYLLNADVTVLANFSNPNSKVKVDFSYVILDLYYDHNYLTTSYINPFAVMKGESKFADVHMVASQVKLSSKRSMQLQKQIEEGRVNLEIKGLFRARSKLGGIFHYSYWMYAHCQLAVTGPPTGVLLRKKCVTKR
ncbi:hypothetical protein AAHA92_18359 [Salvia divinorum]|uniref:Late embryogenesis abundant protein LEA-2 subgroup domain-containing protein n=1 Tax=Salvia divinorum TaxID=28513 RepID=A0ABD1H1V3_SALDI